MIDRWQQRHCWLLALVVLSSFSSSSLSSAAANVDDNNNYWRRRQHAKQLERRPQQLPYTTTDVNDNTPLQHPSHRNLSTNDDESSCTTNEKSFILHFQTDSYGSETSWFLRDDSTDEYIGYGPPDGVSYGDITLYSFSYCLTIGTTYTLAMEDNFGDGMCCNRGVGGYEYLMDDVRVYTSNLEHTFNDYVEHTFTVKNLYTPSPTPAEEPELEMECMSNPTECGCDDVEQEDYRGSISTSESGYTCMKWDDTVDYTSTLYPDADLMGHNYCRSPTGEWPWCYTTDTDVTWEYCRIPSCPTQVKSTSNPTKQPVVATVSPTVAGPTTSRPTLSPVNSPTLSPSVSPSKSPTKVPTNQPTPKPTPDKSVYNPDNGCYGGDIKVLIEAKADQYSDDTSWEFLYPNKTRALHQVANFQPHEFKSKERCLPHGKYTFIIYDAYGDGFCCRYGEGYFRISLDGRLVLNGGSFNDNVTETINVGYEPDGYMTQRDFEYLEAHNIRRKEWHERYNLEYIPMRYSPSVARTSKAWAEELLNSCSIVGIEHEDFVLAGENLAKNTGAFETWGQLYPPENIVKRWVDFEIGLPYPSNGHLTQALWRAGLYVGCGESVKPFRNGVCRVQVCRYIRAGNCDMKRYNSTQGENWLEPMLSNYTRCGPNCPEEGCH